MAQNITRIRHGRHLPAWLLERLPSAALENAPMADQDQPQTTRDDVNRRFDAAYQRLDQRFNRQTATMLAIAARHPLGPGRLRRGRQRAYESYRSHRPTCRAIPVGHGWGEDPFLNFAPLNGQSPFGKRGREADGVVVYADLWRGGRRASAIAVHRRRWRKCASHRCSKRVRPSYDAVGRQVSALTFLALTMCNQ